MKTIRWLLILCLMLPVLDACGQPGATPALAAVDMTVRAEPEPAAVGQAELIITLKNHNGASVDGALLRVHGSMDHAGMMAVDRETSASMNGEYRVPFEWSMGGGWKVTVTAVLPENGGEISQTFDFFVEAVSSESIINQKKSADSQ